MPSRGIKTTGPAVDRGTQVQRIEELTQRQQEVVRLLCVGKFSGEIALELGCTAKTVDSHRAAALSRLGLRNNVELTLLAIRQGIIPDPAINLSEPAYLGILPAQP